MLPVRLRLVNTLLPASLSPVQIDEVVLCVCVCCIADMSMNPISQHHPQFCSWAPPLGNPHLYRHHTYRVSQEGEQYEREHMFEKSLTPSDVGKLNRLVIPKHHAEKYLPLDGEAGERGLLLSFEDESGKPWRFRYSYWSSSQSYVLTKGWSRFVKEKGLDAGDLVSFGRLRGGRDHLCISCRRRGENERPPAACTATTGDAAVPWSPTRYTARAHAPTSHTGDQDLAMAPTHSKRLRLFGVNLDCAPAPEPETKLVLAPETEPTRSGHQCLYKHIY